MKVISKSPAMTVHRTLILVIGYYLTTAGVAEVMDDDEYSEAECPPIVSRDEWGALPAKGVLHSAYPMKLVVLDDIGGRECSTAEDCVQRVRLVQAKFLANDSYTDIGYSFVIGGDGRIYEGLGWRKKGLISIVQTASSLAIGFIGKFENVIPSDAMITALRSLLTCATELEELIERYAIIGNKQLVSPVIEQRYCYISCQNYTNLLEYGN